MDKKQEKVADKATEKLYKQFIAIGDTESDKLYGLTRLVVISSFTSITIIAVSAIIILSIIGG